MDEAPEGDIGSLKFLKTLVTTLMIVMIIGFIVSIGFLVTRFPSGPGLKLPEAITLSNGTVPTAFTQSKDWYAIVTDGDKILIYNRLTGALQQTIQVNIQD